jgi:hypothetical protein
LVQPRLHLRCLFVDVVGDWGRGSVGHKLLPHIKVLYIDYHKNI